MRIEKHETLTRGIKNCRVSKLLKGKDDYLYKELLKWDDLDFSNAVEVHNYVWEKLGGTVGKAIAINEDAVQALKERLSQ